MDWPTAIAAYAAIVSTILLMVRLAEFSRDRDDLSLRMSSGVVIGQLELLLGADHIVQVTVASRGGRPVGVSSLAVQLTGNRTIPLMQHVPVAGSRELPAVLSRGESATYGLAHDALRDELRASGLRMTHMVAHLTDGSTRRAPVPRDFRTLGS